jgi:glutamine amidotransferase
MCELLGMSANVPTDIVFSFTGLMQRGGRTGPHRDGWGIGFYEGRGLRLFQDPAASSESEVANLVQRYPIKSEVVIGHIRQANVGRVCLSNTHPFVRELWGRNWCFAHNGQLGDFSGRRHLLPPGGRYRQRSGVLRPAQPRAQPSPSRSSRAAAAGAGRRLRRIPQQRRVQLPAQRRRLAVLLCSTKLGITRRAPFGPARLKDVDLIVDFQPKPPPTTWSR